MFLLPKYTRLVQGTKFSSKKVVAFFSLVYGFGLLVILVLYSSYQNNVMSSSVFNFVSFFIIFLCAVLSVLWVQKSAKKRFLFMVIGGFFGGLKLVLLLSLLITRLFILMVIFHLKTV
jgi:hypothetical protein